ncbi:spectrin beta chain-like isoform X2 [Tubulanus polymorphus]
MFGQQDSLANFEKGRIKVLQEERVRIQKKTFTKWMNSFLNKVGLNCNDLFTDLGDGKLLMKLLEIISGEKLGRPNPGRLRVQKIENLNRSINFISTKVKLENIGAEDILDGNQRIILGLIWTIILRFQIQDIVIEDDDGGSHEKRSAKEALLLWCQRKTHGYPHCKIKNFSGSWRDGMGFNALIHAHRPDLIDYDKLNPNRPIENLNYAFNVAETELGINRLLDAEDLVNVDKPDEKSVMTYVSSYYHTFAKMKEEGIGGRRIAKVLNNLVNNEKMINDYERLVTDLLQWIMKKCQELTDRNFPNTLDGVRQEMAKFKNYRTVEKPPKYVERGNIEAQMFAIKAKQKASSQRQYVPREGYLIHDIERAWTGLEKAEHDRETALRAELMRQERLEQLAQKFNRKAGLREAWLKDMDQVLTEQSVGSVTSFQAEAAVKKHEAISAEVMERKDRFILLSSIAKELVNGNYHGKENVKAREQEITDKWKDLIGRLQKKKQTLLGYCELMGMFRDLEGLQAEIKEVRGPLQSDDCGKHLMAVDDLLEKHAMIEAQVNAMGRRVHQLNKKAQELVDDDHPSSELLCEKLTDLNKDFENVYNLCATRKKDLDESQKFYQFMQDSEEEESWVTEKQQIVRSQPTGKDLNAVLKALKNHEGLEAELDARWPVCEKVCNNGADLVRSKHPNSKDIRKRIEDLQEKWDTLREMCDSRRTRLNDAVEAHQYYVDADEAEAWMREKMPLVSSPDLGRDESSAEALLRRQNRLGEEINAYEDDIKRLEELARIMTKANHKISPEILKKGGDDDEELIDVPYQVEEEQIVHKEVMRDVILDEKVPQVKALYPYRGQGIKVNQGEVMTLLEKTNNDWWSIKKDNGQEGYVPAKYVKEIEPKLTQRVVRKPVLVPEKVKVKKTVTKKEKASQRKLRRTPSVRSSKNLHYDKDNVEQRQKAISDSYAKLCDLSEARRNNLEDAVKLFRFYRECDEFESWMIEKEKLLEGNETLSQNAELMKRKYRNFLTDLAANRDEIGKINKLADDIVQGGSSQSKKVEKRRKEINDRWDRLQRKKMEREKTLEGASSVELFQNTCDEVKDWINEKANALDNDDLGRDLKGVQALLRKHQNLERELDPLEEKLKQVKYIGTDVKAGYPGEADYVDSRMKELQDLWNDLKDNADKRKKALEQSEEKHKFDDDAKDLMSWADVVKDKLKNKELGRNVPHAEELQKQHEELKNDIDIHEPIFEELATLGEKVMKHSPASAKDVGDKLKQLQAEKDFIDSAWNDRKDDLDRNLDAQLFYKEADQLDSIISSQATFLDFDELGTSVDNAERLMKRHEEFENKLKAQDKRFDAFSKTADDLINRKHPDSANIDKRRKEVLKRCNSVKAKSDARMDQLKAALAFQQFKTDADDLSQWIDEKKEMAQEQSYRDLANLPNKSQKHDAFIAEMKANEKRLQEINATGNGLIEENHYNAEEVENILEDLNKRWAGLTVESKEKTVKMEQAMKQRGHNKGVDAAKDKLDAIMKLLASDDVGNDLRGVKELLKKHGILEGDIEKEEARIRALLAQGDQLAKDGHFDADGIQKENQELLDMYNKLKPLLAEREKKLQDSCNFQQFKFDTDGELQWIKEQIPAASSTDYGKNLIDAQNLHKKHQKFAQVLQGHKPQIDKVVDYGKKLCKENHFAKDEIKEKLDELDKEWDNLLKLSAERDRNLNTSLKCQQYLSKANEVENWMTEKEPLVQATDYGKDEVAADNLLTKHKAFESDLATYAGIVDDLGNQARALSTLPNADITTISKRQNQLEKKMKKLQEDAAARKRNLKESKNFHAYVQESDECMDWVKENMQIAESEDYGQDYEHLLELQKKFDEFKLSIDTGSERIQECDQLASKLIANNSPYADEIEDRQNELGMAWDQLLEQIEARDQKLEGAGDIHRFNRDVEDTLSRIQEKYDAVPDDCGRDIHGNDHHTKKHKGFENDLVALEAQINVLRDDSNRLQAAYPGGNAEQIQEQEGIVVENWQALQHRATQRADELNEAGNLFKFLASVRDLMDWSKVVQADMAREVVVRDLSSVDLLKKEHDQLQKEIDARDDDFTQLVDMGETMIAEGHSATGEIQEKVDQLKDEQIKIRKAWKKKHDQLIETEKQQQFYRDANQLDTLSASQEARLKNSDLGDTVDKVESQLRKHEAFEKLLTSQEEKVIALQDLAKKLIDEDNFDKKNIGKRLEEVIDRRKQIKRLSDERRQKLLDALLYTQFNRDAEQEEKWMKDRLKIINAAAADVGSNIQEKMKKLQKHQAFEAELLANAERVEHVKQLGKQLISKGHPESASVKQRVDELSRLWDELLKASENRSKLLEEAKDILKFNEEVEAVESWIREKEAIIHAGDCGRDYEHCLELQKRLNDVGTGVLVDEARIEAVNDLGTRLINQGRSDTKDIKEKKDSMNKRWKGLHGMLDGHKAKLAAALEIHKFNRDVDDVTDRINEKALLLSSEDVGKSLPTVQALQRKQEDIARDMTALQNQLEKLESLASKLSKKYPDMKEQIINKQQELLDCWENLENLCDLRKAKLDESYQLQKFLADAKELINWSNDMMTRMTSGELASDTQEAVNLIEMHQERKAEIDGRQKHVLAVKNHGMNLLNMNHPGKDVIQKTLSELKDVQSRLDRTWYNRNILLTQCYDLQNYKEYAELCHAWLATKEAFLANADLGHNISSVDNLVKNHSSFEKTIIAQEEKIDKLATNCKKLVSQDHYAADEINSRCQEVIDRRNKLRQACKVRALKLQDSKRLQIFLQSIFEVNGWINDKMQVATDESYRDPVNLQGKIQKHQTFEAEIMANKGIIDQINKEADSLIADKHYAHEEVLQHQDDVNLLWKGLLAACHEKRDKLSEAYQALLFNRVLDDFDSWMEDCETHLTSEDHGKDLTTVTKLIKKQQLLEQDIKNHQVKVNEIEATADKFEDENHFQSFEIRTRVNETVERYQSLGEPCQIRSDNLEDARLMYEFNRDVQDEMLWIKEKLPFATSKDLGDGLVAVQSLIKKHQALQSEIAIHEPIIASVSADGRKMIDRDHFASDEIARRLKNLNGELEDLKKHTEQRMNKLEDALQSQQYYVYVAEAESWIDDKKTLLSSRDYGKDEDTAKALLKKLDAQDLDIENFNNTIRELAATSKKLINQQHFDSERINDTQIKVETNYRNLQKLAKSRRQALIENKRLFEFFREADDVDDWIKEKMVTAASDDYGIDLDHVQVHQHKFEDFLRALYASEDRVANIDRMAQKLSNDNHPQSDAVMKRASVIKRMWLELKEIAQARKAGLEAAKQVHSFDREADDLIEWINEKEGMASSDNYGHDLETVETLVRKHEGFERDLAAVGEKVENLTKESKKLQDHFTDNRDAKDRIHSKHIQYIQAWNTLLDKASSRGQKLMKAKELQVYFDDYRELLAWCTEMRAKITTEKFAHDVPSAEALINYHMEYKAEIDTRLDSFEAFTNTGNKIIAEGHFLSKEIAEKISLLNMAKDNLLKTWENRRILYERHLDVLLLVRDIDQVNTLLAYREDVLKTAVVGDSIKSVEDNIRKHEDFEKAAEALEEKIKAIQRKTLIEQAFEDQKRSETKMEIEEKERQEKIEKEERKRREQDKILQDRKRDENKRRAHDAIRRRTTEIKLPPHLLEIVPEQQPTSTERRGSLQMSKSFKDVNAAPDRLSSKQVGSIINRSVSVKTVRPIIKPRDRVTSENTSPLSLVPPSQIDYKPESPKLTKSSPDIQILPPRATITVDKDKKPVEVTGDKGVKLSVSTSPPVTAPVQAAPVFPRAEDVPVHVQHVQQQQRSPPPRFDEPPKPKRALSFQTRTTTGGFKEKHKLVSDLPPVDFEGLLEKKQILQSGSRKAVIRSWKYMYTVICGEYICFFKDKHAFNEAHASVPPSSLHKAVCEIATDYTKKKNVLSIKLQDGSEFYLAAETQTEMLDWSKAIQTAAAPPVVIKRHEHKTTISPRLPSSGPPPAAEDDSSSDEGEFSTEG